jgi:hypothetical protein
MHILELALSVHGPFSVAKHYTKLSSYSLLRNISSGLLCWGVASKVGPAGLEIEEGCTVWAGSIVDGRMLSGESESIGCLPILDIP